MMHTIKKAAALFVAAAILLGSIPMVERFCHNHKEMENAVSDGADQAASFFQDAAVHVQAAENTPVQEHGALKVSGTDLKDSNGNKIQLKGVSTHGIAWFPQYVNKAAFQTLRDNYGINLIRLAMYTNASEGYGTDSIKKVPETFNAPCSCTGVFSAAWTCTAAS